MGVNSSVPSLCMVIGVNGLKVSRPFGKRVKDARDQFPSKYSNNRFNKGLHNASASYLR